MDYKSLLKSAGVKDQQVDYLNRKLKQKNVPKEHLNRLGEYFPLVGEVAGVNLHELGMAMHEAANKPEKEKPEEKPKAAVKDGDSK